MTWQEQATNLIQQFEGCSLVAYPDPISKGDPWTCGWGATGPQIAQGTVWTQQQADNDLAQRIAALGGEIDALVKVSLNDYQKGALTSFAYNLGIEALANSTLLIDLNAGNYAAAADQILLWDHANGVVVPGLARRRIAEQQVFLT